MNPWLIAAGVGLGLVKTKQQIINAQKQSELESTRARFSPWTGAQARQVGPIDMLGNLMAGGSAGAMMGQGMETQAMNKEMHGAKMDYLKGQNVPSAGGGPSMSPVQSNPQAPRSAFPFNDPMDTMPKGPHYARAQQQYGYMPWSQAYGP